MFSGCMPICWLDRDPLRLPPSRLYFFMFCAKMIALRYPHTHAQTGHRLAATPEVLLPHRL